MSESRPDLHLQSPIRTVLALHSDRGHVRIKFSYRKGFTLIQTTFPPLGVNRPKVIKDMPLRKPTEVPLVAYRCPKCGRWLCDALPCSLAWCEKCGVWVNKQGEIIPPGEVRGYTVREYNRRQAEAEVSRRPVRRRRPKQMGLETLWNTTRRQIA